MNKTYSETLGEWLRKTKHKHRGPKLAAFFAAKADIEEALDKGYAAKLIWTHLSETGRIDFSYVTFMTYVNRHIRNKEASKSGTSNDLA